MLVEMTLISSFFIYPAILLLINAGMYYNNIYIKKANHNIVDKYRDLDEYN